MYIFYIIQNVRFMNIIDILMYKHRYRVDIILRLLNIFIHIYTIK